MLLTTLSQSGAHAASSKLSSSQCKQAILSFQGLYYNPTDPTPQWTDGYVNTPLISELTARRNFWKSIEPKLSKGPIKSYFQDLISKSFVMINKRDAIYRPGHTSGTGDLGGSIYGITKSCVPGETNEFCKTFPSSLTSVSNLSQGQSISKSGVLNTRRIWSTEVKRWPAGSNSKAWLNRLITSLDEMIAEAKAKRDLAGIYTILLDEWGNIDRNNDVIDFWPCRDLALEALGIFLDDKWDN
jgi:hypothetical protein